MKPAAGCVTILALLLGAPQSRAADTFPPGWLPISQLDGKPTWSAVREDKEHIQLYGSPLFSVEWLVGCGHDT